MHANDFAGIDLLPDMRTRTKDLLGAFWQARIRKLESAGPSTANSCALAEAHTELLKLDGLGANPHQ